MDAPSVSDAGSYASGAERPDRQVPDTQEPDTGSPAPPTIRRITADDGELLRTVRLSAIADSPGVYATTLAEARSRPMFQWERVAEASAHGGDQATFFAKHGEVVAGMVSAYRTANNLVSMTSLWSAPGFRDTGVGESLVLAVSDWGVSIGGDQLRIWVVQRNEHARRFYEWLGFEATGQEMQYEPDPRLVEYEMRKPLVPLPD